MSIQTQSIKFGLFLGFIFMAGSAPTFGAKPDNKFDQILQRLESIEAKLDQTATNLDSIEGKIDALAGPQTSATFCINQGRALNLEANWGGGIEGELNLGPAWVPVIKAEGTVELDLPLALAIGPVPVLPLPTEAKIEVGGGLGRSTDICIELPITLAPEDQARLSQIALDINSNTTNNDPGKFQKRAGRILNYADRRVPPFRQNSGANDLGAFLAEQDMSSEFDRSDVAGDSIMDNGLGAVTEGLAIFRDPNIKELIATLEIPIGIRDFMNNPERMFDGLPDLRAGEGPMFCNDVGVSGAMRERNERLNKLCSRLEDLPTFDRVRNSADRIDQLSDELVDAIAEVLAPVLNNAGETADETKSRFCASRIGQRRAFDRYCGR